MHVLVPCPSCARHIATTETYCPFCTSTISEDLAARAIPANTRRLRRFAMFTFTTTAATGFGVLAACTGNSEMSAAFYGAPCIGDDGGACYTPPPSEGFDGAGYGSQPDANLLDASADGDATFLDDSGDAGEDAD